MNIEAFLDLLVDFGQNEFVKAVITYGQVGFLVVGTKIILHNNKAGKQLFDRIVFIFTTVKSLLTELGALRDEVKQLREEQALSKEKIAQSESKNDLLSEMIKTFVSGTKIPIDTKIQVAKIFDEIKKIDLLSHSKKLKEEALDSVKEIIENEKDTQDVKAEKLSSYAKALQQMAVDEDETEQI